MRTETVYTIIIVALAAVGGYFLAPGRELALSDIVLVKVVSVATFMALAVGLIASLRGVNYNVLDEVFDQNNTAGALFVGLMLVSLALVVAG